MWELDGLSPSAIYADPTPTWTHGEIRLSEEIQAHANMELRKPAEGLTLLDRDYRAGSFLPPEPRIAGGGRDRGNEAIGSIDLRNPLHHHLRSPNDDMGSQGHLPLPRKDCRARSKDRTKADPMTLVRPRDRTLGFNIRSSDPRQPGTERYVNNFGQFSYVTIISHTASHPVSTGTQSNVFRRRQTKRPNLSDYTVDQSAPEYGQNSSWWSTAFSPLKRVARGLSAILKHCDV